MTDTQIMKFQAGVVLILLKHFGRGRLNEILRAAKELADLHAGKTTEDTPRTLQNAPQAILGDAMSLKAKSGK